MEGSAIGSHGGQEYPGYREQVIIAIRRKNKFRTVNALKIGVGEKPKTSYFQIQWLGIWKSCPITILWNFMYLLKCLLLQTWKLDPLQKNLYFSLNKIHLPLYWTYVKFPSASVNAAIYDTSADWLCENWHHKKIGVAVAFLPPNW